MHFFWNGIYVWNAYGIYTYYGVLIYVWNTYWNDSFLAYDQASFYIHRISLLREDSVFLTFY